MPTNNFNAASGEWNTAGNWSLGHVPTSSEDTTFTGIDGSGALTITTTAAVAKSVDFSTAGAAFELSGSVGIAIYGSLTCKTGMTWSNTAALTIGRGASGTLTSNGVNLSAISKLFAGYVGGSCTLADSLNIGFKQIAIDPSYGNVSFVTGGNTITSCGTFSDNGGTGSVTLTLGTSTINCSNVSFAAATLTVNHTGIVNLTTVANGLTTCFGQGTVSGTGWGTVNYLATPTAAAVYALQFPTSGANLVGLNISYAADRRDGSFTINNPFSLATSSTWKGGGVGFDDPTIRPLISGTPIGTAKTVTVSAASQTMTFTDVDFRDMVVAATNTPTITGTRVGDAGGNTNVDTDAPKTVYAAGIGATKNFYNTIWSATDEATYAARAAVVDINQFPLAQDTAILDDKSFSGTRLLALNAPRMGAINAAALTSAESLDIYSMWYYGNITFPAAISIAASPGTPSFDARVVGTLSINSSVSLGTANVSIQSFGGTVRLLTNNLTHTGTFALAYGTFDLNGKTLTTNTFLNSNSNTRSLIDSAGGGKIKTTAVTGTVFDQSTATNLTVSNAPDIEIGTGAQTLTGDVTVAGGGKAFGTFLNHKHAGEFDTIINGASNTFESITIETPDDTYRFSHLKLWTGTTTTLTANPPLIAAGTSTYPIEIDSTTLTAATISMANSASLTLVNIGGITVSGGGVLTSTGCNNGGNSTVGTTIVFPLWTPVAAYQAHAVTQANMRISAVAALAFTDFSAADHLTPYLGARLVIKDSVGKKLIGNVLAAGVSEGLGDEKCTDTGFDNAGSWSGSTGFSVGSSVLIAASAGDAGNENQVGILGAVDAGKLIKIVFSVLTRTAGAFSARLRSQVSGYSSGVSGAITNYLVATSIVTGAGIVAVGTTSGTCDDFSCKQVLSPSATGVTITNGSAQSWISQEVGFNYNDASGYTFWLFTSGPTMKIMINGAWKSATPSIMVNGTWKAVTSAQVMVGGVWKAV